MANLLVICGDHMQLGPISAAKYTKSQGAGFTGWVVRDERDRLCYSDPIPTKREAIKAMREMLGDASLL